MEMLQSKEVEAFYSKCLTITFDRRLKSPESGKVFLVDVDRRIPLPTPIRSGAISVSHNIPPYVSTETKFRLARELLDIYRDQARLVITTKLHCALPCIAMGIPVIFFGDRTNYRVSILEDLGVGIHRYALQESQIPRFLHRARLLISSRSVNWNPDPVYIEAEKDGLRKLVRDRLAQYSV